MHIPLLLGADIWLQIALSYLSHLDEYFDSGSCRHQGEQNAWKAYRSRFALLQPQVFRATDGERKIWGKKPTFVVAKYTSGSGTQDTSLLLTSGKLLDLLEGQVLLREESLVSNLDLIAALSLRIAEDIPTAFPLFLRRGQWASTSV